MKKFTAIFLAILILMSNTVLLARAEQTDAALAGASTLQAQKPLGGSEKLLSSAKAAILYDLNTDTLVYAWNPDARINPTGMVKFLTVLIALEEGDLDQSIKVTRRVLDTVTIGAVSAGLKVGEEITLRELLYCVMIASANDAAAVIADYLGGEGRQAAFAQKMNEKAKALGCTGSNFTNAHGLADPQQYSTARDLAIIVEAALENPLFASMFSMETYTVPATNKSEERQLKTTNFMMSTLTVKNYLDDRITGGKPAAASNTDRSMICTAQVGIARYLCVVMSCDSQVSQDGLVVTNFGNFVETKALIDYGQANFVVRQVIDSRQTFSQFGVSGGENDVVLRPSRDVFTMLPKNYDISKLELIDRVETDKLKAPIEKGAVLGAVTVRYGSVILGTCDLLAQYAVAEAGSTIGSVDRFEQKPQEQKSYWFILNWIVIILGALLILAVLVLLLIRIYNGARVRRAHRRRMRQRRRSR